MSSAEAGLDPSGPRVVAIGGGHGLAASLRAMRRYAGHVTAVVTTADDGGSSGRLRESLDVPAPGDMRLCLHALAADPEALWARTAEHRFDKGDLDGHAVGNVMMLALADQCGSMVEASRRLGELIGAVGDVLPATTTPTHLSARVRSLADGPGDLVAEQVVHGQVAVATTAPVTEVSLVPGDVETPPEVAAAIGAADQVVLGPGSLFTSVLAAAVVPGVNRALAATSARKVWVANLHEQEHETTGFTVADHVEALARHGVEVDVVLHEPGTLPVGDLRVAVHEAPLARSNGLAHDPERLAVALAALVR